MGTKIKREFTEIKILLRSVPSVVLGLFVLSVFSMNLLANKSIDIPVDWLALDCGIIVSWFAFLSMDIITKHFGPKAATQISVLAILLNLAMCLIFFLGSLIPGTWSQSYADDGTVIQSIGEAIDKTFGGTWFVLLGSTAAFCVSAIVNNFTNWGIGKLFKKNPDSAAAYFLRTYVSTAVGQFLDNLVFALIVSMHFFGWSFVACLTCAATGMVAELICEAAFSYFGFAICKKWKRENVGKEYFDFVNGTQQNNVEVNI